MKKLLYAIPILLLVSLNCNKRAPGETYFECQINGQWYKACQSSSCIDATISGDTALVLGGEQGVQYVGIGVITKNKITASTYQLSSPSQLGFFKPSTTPNDYYNTDSVHSGTITIQTIDLRNALIYCSFEFTGYRKRTGETARVTNGKIVAHFIRE